MDNAENELKCCVCGTGESKNCGGCGIVAYCSVKCQAADRPSHKKSCFPYLIKSMNEIKGSSSSLKTAEDEKCWVATRDLAPGSIIYEEKSIFHIPSINFGSKNSDKNQAQLSKYSSVVEVDDRGGIIQEYDRFCISCGLHLSKFMAKPCKKCGWPICSEKCEKSSVHVENECKIFTLEKKEFSSFSPSAALQLIIMTRISEMRIHKPKVWSSLMNLENLPLSPFFPPPNSSQSSSDSTPMDETKFKLMMNSMTQDLKNIRLLCRLKGFCIDSMSVKSETGKELPGYFRSGFFVYVKSGYLRHSCAPNCMWSIGPCPDFKIRIRAKTLVKKGDVLTISHLSGHGGERRGTFGRQRIILDRFGIKCDCSLCRDPSELQSFSSAIVCTCSTHLNNSSSSNQNLTINLTTTSVTTTSSTSTSSPSEEKNPGYLLPLYSSKKEEDPCMKCTLCSNIVKITALQPDLEEVAKKIGDWEEKQAKNISNPSSSSIFAALKFSKDIKQTYTGSFLHQNHWLVQWTERVALQHFKSLLFTHADVGNYKKVISIIGEAQIDESMKQIKYLLEIEEKISPGLSAFKAELNHLMSLSLLCTLEKLKSVLSGGSVLPWAGVEKKLIDYRKFHMEAFLFYKNEVGNGDGKKICGTTQQLKTEEDFANQLESQIRKYYENKQ